MTRKVQIEMGSGNIFADLGLPDAETHFLKAQIVSELYRVTKQRKLTQTQADGHQPARSVAHVQGQLP